MAALTTLDLSGAAGARLELSLLVAATTRSGRGCRVERFGLFVRLSGCGLGDSGAEALAGALPKMASLTALDLSGAFSHLC
jgi:hypothetical protein